VRSGVVAERGKNGAEAEIRTPDLLITKRPISALPDLS